MLVAAAHLVCQPQLCEQQERPGETGSWQEAEPRQHPDVLEEEQMECSALMVKYMSKGMDTRMDTNG